MARSLSNIKKPHYRVLYRDPAAFTVPADLTAWGTFLGTFTELGYCEDKTIKLKGDKGDQITVDDGTKLTQGFNFSLEAKLLQTEAADFTAIGAIHGTSQDILLYAADANRAIFIPTAVPYFLEDTTSGETEAVPMTIERENLASQDDFRTRFAVPTS